MSTDGQVYIREYILPNDPDILPPNLFTDAVYIKSWPDTPYTGGRMTWRFTYHGFKNRSEIKKYEIWFKPNNAWLDETPDYLSMVMFSVYLTETVNIYVDPSDYGWINESFFPFHDPNYPGDPPILGMIHSEPHPYSNWVMPGGISSLTGSKKKGAVQFLRDRKNLQNHIHKSDISKKPLITMYIEGLNTNVDDFRAFIQNVNLGMYTPTSVNLNLVAWTNQIISIGSEDNIPSIDDSTSDDSIPTVFDYNVYMLDNVWQRIVLKANNDFGLVSCRLSFHNLLYQIDEYQIYSSNQDDLVDIYGGVIANIITENGSDLVITHVKSNYNTSAENIIIDLKYSNPNYIGKFDGNESSFVIRWNTTITDENILSPWGTKREIHPGDIQRNGFLRGEVDPLSIELGNTHTDTVVTRSTPFEYFSVTKIRSDSPSGDNNITYSINKMDDRYKCKVDMTDYSKGNLYVGWKSDNKMNRPTHISFCKNSYAIDVKSKAITFNYGVVEIKISDVSTSDSNSLTCEFYTDMEPTFVTCLGLSNEVTDSDYDSDSYSEEYTFNVDLKYGFKVDGITHTNGPVNLSNNSLHVCKYNNFERLYQYAWRNESPNLNIKVI